MALSVRGLFGRLFGAAGVAAVLAFVAVSGGCTSLVVTEQQYVQQVIVPALKEAADGVDAMCGVGTPEAQAARDASADLYAKMIAYRMAGDRVFKARKMQIESAETIDEMNKEANKCNDVINAATSRVTERLNGTYRGDLFMLDAPNSSLLKRVIIADFPNNAQKHADEGRRLWNWINESSVATDAEKAQATALMNELNSDLEQARNTAANTLPKVKEPGPNTGNTPVEEGLSLLGVLEQKTKIAMSKLQILQNQIVIRDHQARRDTQAAVQVAAQAEYEAAKPALDEALATAAAAQTAAAAKAEECAIAQGITPPPWPRNPTWQSTFWDISS